MLPRKEADLRLVLDLWRKVETDVSHLLDAVLDHQRHVLGERDEHRAREGRSLGEEVKVAQREVQGDGLLEVYLDLLLLFGVHAAVRPDGHVATAHLARNGEFDAVLAHRNGDRVTKDGEVLADALELIGWHLNAALVVGVGDAKVLGINVHQLELEVRDAVLGLVLKHEGHGVGLVIRLESDDVVVIAALEHLAHVCQVDAQRDVAVAAEMVEAVGTQQQRHERHVAGVHGLQRDARR
mmetsp:Transcript_25393/g.51039  ORF Transcript_25393/g.51039 Transcript_25393/m.51039 type:complete len:239 (-) Transcript_25393:158-874(-)